LSLHLSTVMLMVMKNNRLINLLLSATFITFTAQADLYKGLNEAGNIVYSDQPFENAVKFTPQTLSVIDAPKVEKKQLEEVSDKDEVADFKYTDFDIISPKNNQAIWNEPALIVSLRLKPGLNSEAGHTIWLLMDGKPIVKNHPSLSMQIGRADRGAHQLQAQVRDKNGKIVVRSRAVIVHIKNTVVRRTAN